jgi:hypothetical protein
MSILRVSILALALPGAVFAQSAAPVAVVASPRVAVVNDVGDRFAGGARSGERRGSLVLDLVAVEDGGVVAQIRFGGGLSGSGRVQGVIRRGMLHLSGIVADNGARYDIAMRVTARDDGALAGFYEMSEQQTRARQTGNFTLTGVDWAPSRATASR